MTQEGRGYPSIDSLRELSRYFSVSLDDLLSSEEILTAAEEEHKEREGHTRDLVFGLLDCSIAMFLFLPFFGQKINGVIQEVSLLSLTEYETYIKIPYLLLVVGLVLTGVLTLALQNCENVVWVKWKSKLSMMISAVATLLFIMSLQPYAGMFTFLFLVIKAIMLIKWI